MSHHKFEFDRSFITLTVHIPECLGSHTRASGVTYQSDYGPHTRVEFDRWFITVTAHIPERLGLHTRASRNVMSHHKFKFDRWFITVTVHIPEYLGSTYQSDESSSNNSLWLAEYCVRSWPGMSGMLGHDLTYQSTYQVMTWRSIQPIRASARWGVRRVCDPRVVPLLRQGHDLKGHDLDAKAVRRDGRKPSYTPAGY